MILGIYQSCKGWLECRGRKKVVWKLEHRYGTKLAVAGSNNLRKKRPNLSVCTWITIKTVNMPSKNTIKSMQGYQGGTKYGRWWRLSVVWMTGCIRFCVRGNGQGLEWVDAEHGKKYRFPILSTVSFRRLFQNRQTHKISSWVDSIQRCILKKTTFLLLPTVELTLFF